MSTSRLRPGVQVALGTLPLRRLPNSLWHCRCRWDGDVRVVAARLPFAEELLDPLDFLLHGVRHGLVETLVRALRDVCQHLAQPPRHGPVLWVSSKQPMDEGAKLGTPCHRVLEWDEILRIGDRHGGGIVLEGMSVEGQGVQDATQHPNVHLLTDRVALSVVQLDVGHLRWPVEHRHCLVDLLLQLHQSGSWKLLRRHVLSTARAEVAELPVAISALQDVLHLEVAVLDWRLLRVKMTDSIDDLHERIQHFSRGEFAVLAVHEVEEVPTAAELHEEFDGATTSRMFVG
mmetsp:Transcript_39450/g.91523  ORF Transcript_39450/g.91523 Transcript_39450/m.91523 type:complete len:288 (+) Transcript_39450:820-1683(+)